jgi:hypothetical protein
LIALLLVTLLRPRITGLGANGVTFKIAAAALRTCQLL